MYLCPQVDLEVPQCHHKLLFEIGSYNNLRLGLPSFYYLIDLVIIQQVDTFHSYWQDWKNLSNSKGLIKYDNIQEKVLVP